MIAPDEKCLSGTGSKPDRLNSLDSGPLVIVAGLERSRSRPPQEVLGAIAPVPVGGIEAQEPSRPTGSYCDGVRGR